MAAAETTVAAYDGRRRLGHVVQRGRQHVAYDARGQRLGAFPTRIAALAEIGRRDRGEDSA